MLKDKIKVGDYVRNKYGIAKVLEISEDIVKHIQTIKFDRPICFWVNTKTGEERNRTNILPITPNIDLDKIKIGKLIDLIEVGDYVDGYKVEEIERKKNGDFYIDMGDGCWLDQRNIANYPIKSIVTHEQMEVMEYKIEK